MIPPLPYFVIVEALSLQLIQSSSMIGLNTLTSNFITLDTKTQVVNKHNIVMYCPTNICLFFQTSKKKDCFMISQPIVSMCHLTLKTPASFLEVDAFELNLEPPPTCAHLQGGCEPTCSDCWLKLSLKH
jgi:hypothetical protein